MAEDRERPAGAPAPAEIGHDHTESEKPDEAPEALRNRDHAEEEVRLEEEDDADERRDPEAEGDREEGLDLGDVDGPQPLPGIELVAQPGADDGREAGRVRDRLGDERGERGATEGQAALGEREREMLVADERREANRRAGHRDKDPMPAYRCSGRGARSR